MYHRDETSMRHHPEYAIRELCDDFNGLYYGEEGTGEDERDEGEEEEGEEGMTLEEYMQAIQGSGNGKDN